MVPVVCGSQEINASSIFKKINLLTMNHQLTTEQTSPKRRQTSNPKTLGTALFLVTLIAELVFLGHRRPALRRARGLDRPGDGAQEIRALGQHPQHQHQGGWPTAGRMFVPVYKDPQIKRWTGFWGIFFRPCPDIGMIWL